MLEQHNRGDPIGRSPTPVADSSDIARDRHVALLSPRARTAPRKMLVFLITDGQTDELHGFANPHEAHVKTSTIA